MSTSESSGLYATLLILLNAYLEGFVVEFIRFKLKHRNIGLSHLDHKTIPYNFCGEEISIQMEPEKSLIARLKENIEKKLEKATHGSLDELMQQVLGQKMSSLIDPEYTKAWKSLVSLRNIIAHGRPLEYRLNGLNPDLNFDDTQLKTVMNYLSEKRVIAIEENLITGPIDALLSERVIRHYHNVTFNITRQLIEALDNHERKMFIHIPELFTVDN